MCCWDYVLKGNMNVVNVSAWLTVVIVTRTVDFIACSAFAPNDQLP